MKKKLSIGIMGLGVVGSALYHYLAQFEHFDFKLYDPFKDLDEDLSNCHLAFICVPVNTNQDRSQDLTSVYHCLNKLRQYRTFINRPIFLKSTVLPGTCKELSEQFMLKVYHMPEFLTERTANQDMLDHDVVVGGRDEMSYEHMLIVKHLFDGKKIHFMRNAEAELAKYTHNAFAAVKVNFFNIINSACETLKCDYEQVLKGIQVSGFIEKHHTKVPGPDLQYGYGGKCLPKDLKAFIGLLEKKGIVSESLKLTELENNKFRKL